MALIKNLINEGWLKTPEVIKAFKKVKREDFLPVTLKSFSQENIAFSIGEGQTISQPQVVALMVELLEVKKTDNVLDIGSGSGWTSTLLAELTKNGRVTAIEIIPDLKEFGKKNAKKYGFKNLEFIVGDGSRGYEKNAPFDKILVSAETSEVFESWKSQLKEGGIIVFPMANSIWKYKKKGNEFKKEEFPGYLFVPLVKK